MKRQKEMENAMIAAHSQFISSLEKSMDILAQEINEASEMSSICTDEWCMATEDYIDDLHKYIYSISEPRWLSESESEKIRGLRYRIKNLYVKFQQAKKGS